MGMGGKTFAASAQAAMLISSEATTLDAESRPVPALSVVEDGGGGGDDNCSCTADDGAVHVPLALTLAGPAGAASSADVSDSFGHRISTKLRGWEHDKRSTLAW